MVLLIFQKFEDLFVGEDVLGVSTGALGVGIFVMLEDVSYFLGYLFLRSSNIFHLGYLLQDERKLSLLFTVLAEFFAQIFLGLINVLEVAFEFETHRGNVRLHFIKNFVELYID